MREFLFGVELFETTATRVERVAVHSNAIGVTVHRSENVELDRVTATGNTSNGIEVGFSDGVVVRRSTAADNGLFGIVDRFSCGLHVRAQHRCRQPRLRSDAGPDRR